MCRSTSATSPIGDFCLQQARFGGQFSISPGPFSAPGDSGSLIVSQSGNQPVGLLFAGGDGLTIATPIDVVLQALRRHDRRFAADRGPALGSLGPLRVSPAQGSVSLSWTASGLRRRLADHELQGVSRDERGSGDVPRERRHLDDVRRLGADERARPTTTRCPPRTPTARARSRTRSLRRRPTSFLPTCRCRPSTTSTA